MIVLCFLPPRSLAQVRRAFPPPHHVSSAPTWTEVITGVRNRACDVAILDPCESSERSETTLAARLDGLASVAMPAGTIPIVGHVSVSTTGIRAVQGLARLGVTDVVIRGVDDTADGLVLAVHRALSSSAASCLVTRVRPFHCLPGTVAAALQQLFRRPEQFRSVADIADAARTTRRSLDRCLARTGLAPAGTLLACARANVAYQLVATEGVRRTHAASRIGYASPRSLARDLRKVTGLTASGGALRLSREAFAEALTRRLVRPLVKPASWTPPY